jgi:hypothetical protein
VLAKGKTDTGRSWVYVRDDAPFGAGGDVLLLARLSIGIQNSYDLFQAESACAIHPVSYEARMNMFSEAEVRTPA